ncbi:MAG: glycosyltransferase [Gemmatimonadales bacterium]|nr:glycosyltransferase [Gemmatimonadales bacterium]
MTGEAVKLGIVIVHYNSSTDLDRCLDSLAAFPPSCPHRVVVVDNASRDEGLAEVHRRYPDCHWIFNSENTGYAKGCNQGMAQLDSEYFLVLNPDIVVKPGALDSLLVFADVQPRAGLIGPQLLNEDGSIQNSCRRFYTFGTLLLRRTFLGKLFPRSRTVRLHLMQDFDHQSSRPVDWVLGGCILVRRSALERTGPMDERFFLYFEDVDWCYRMWQAGCEVQYTPDARFVHRHRRDSSQGKFNRSFWLHLGSLISFYEKWGILVWLLKKWREPLLVFLLWAVDMAGLVAAFGLAYVGRNLAGGLFPEPLFPFSEYRPILYFSLLLTSATFLLTGRYRPGWLRRQPGLGSHLQQVGIVAVLLLASTYLGHLDVISRAVLLLFIPLLGVTTGIGGRLFHQLLRRLERGHLVLERTLLCGSPQLIRDWLAGAPDLSSQGVDVAGYVADAEGVGGAQPALGGGVVPWLGPRDQILEVVRRYRISQVVFWDRPTPGDSLWPLVAGLRRLRIRLRWQMDEVWLLASGARVEMFGSEPSAVLGVGSAAALQMLAGRLATILFGLILGVLGWLPWLGLKLILIPGRKSRISEVEVADLWGHRLALKMAVGRDGKVLSIFWQWLLAWPLLRGDLALFGARPVIGASFSLPGSAAEILAFWESRPQRPGLAGRGSEWNVVRRGAGDEKISSWTRFRNLLTRLWLDPCGFGFINPNMLSSAEKDRFPQDGNEAPTP